MSDIQITFDDGTTELRPDNCPSLSCGSLHQNHPSWFTDAEVVHAWPEPVVFFRGREGVETTHAIRAWREGDCLVWCVTGQDPETRALTGEWRRCYVDSYAQEVVRLEAALRRAQRDADNQRLLADAYLGLASGRDRVTAEEDGTYTQTGVAVEVLSHLVFSALRASRAKNLVSFGLTAMDGERALVTVQRPDGKTSEELRRVEKARADAAEAKIAHASRFTFGDREHDRHIHLASILQEDGAALWAIRRGDGAGASWTREGVWEMDRFASSKTADFLARARWSFEEGWTECERIVREGIWPTGDRRPWNEEEAS